MTTNYSIWLSSPTGERVAVLDRFVRLEYRRRVNDPGFGVGLFGRVSYPFTLTLALPSLPPSLVRLFQRDYRLEVWRSVDGGLLELDTETVWFISQVVRRVMSKGERVLIVYAEPAISLLSRRVVAFAAGSVQAQKSGPADNLMRAIVRENFGSESGAGRDVSAWLTVPPAGEDRSAGATLSKAFAWRNVLTVLQELAEASAEAGGPIFFDVVAPTPATLRFETYAQVRGTDHSRSNSRGMEPVVLSVEMGTLTDVVRSVEWREEVTAVYVAGQGARAAREVVEVTDTARAALVPFGRRETLHDARQVAVTTGLTDEGHARLQAGQPADTFSARVVSRPAALYGVHWRFGDRVTAEFGGEVMTCRVEQVQVSVTRDGEKVTADLVLERSGTGATRLSRGAEASETEHVFQQVQQTGVPAGEFVLIPASGQLVVYGRYTVAGTLHVAAGGELRVLP
ncbi:MAG: hypothetical protein HC884_01475 [Chloroflexaceae bacterium]|nr:hypothetical protein [Chloroflexaceae bacterium]